MTHDRDNSPAPGARQEPRPRLLLSVAVVGSGGQWRHDGRQRLLWIISIGPLANGLCRFAEATYRKAA